jgi:hypothetical protein
MENEIVKEESHSLVVETFDSFSSFGSFGNTSTAQD